MLPAGRQETIKLGRQYRKFYFSVDSRPLQSTGRTGCFKTISTQAVELASPTRATIDLARVRSNLHALRRRCPAAGVIAVVKADAYGHGAIPVAKTLVEAGAEYLAVAHVREAAELRESGISHPILVMSPPASDELPTASRLDVEVVVHSVEAATAVATRIDGPLKVHLKVDTGMHRLGIAVDECDRVLEILGNAQNLHLAGLWTHFACADEPHRAMTEEQYAKFSRIVAAHGRDVAMIHASNSAATAHFPHFLQGDARTFVRLGIGLYGLIENLETSEKLGLSQVMRLTSRLVQVRAVDAGETVSYGATWTAPERRLIGTVAAGYADGYRRILSNRASVGINGKAYPLAGRVCMDMIMIDLGPDTSDADVPRTGDEVVLMGDGGPTAFDLATWAETIPYEICTGISRRVGRIYTG